MILEALHRRGQADLGHVRRYFAAGLCLVATLAASGCGGGEAPAPASSAAESTPATDTPSPQPSAAPEPSEEGWIGVVVAREAVDVAAEVPGRVRSVGVRPGDRVARGDLLARLDTSQLSQDLAMAEASLEAVRAEGRRTRSALQEAKTRHERRAAVPDTFSREELASTEMEMETAEAAAEAAEAREREQAARIEQLREALAKTDVRAPFAGTVALRYLDPGATVAAGTPIVRLITSDDLLVRFAAPPEQAARITAGEPVEIVLETTGVRVTGKVTQVAPEIDGASQMIFMEARLDEASRDGTVRSGLVARVFPAQS